MTLLGTVLLTTAYVITLGCCCHGCLPCSNYRDRRRSRQYAAAQHALVQQAVVDAQNAHNHAANNI